MSQKEWQVIYSYLRQNPGATDEETIAALAAMDPPVQVNAGQVKRQRDKLQPKDPDPEKASDAKTGDSAAPTDSAAPAETDAPGDATNPTSQDPTPPDAEASAEPNESTETAAAESSTEAQQSPSSSVSDRAETEGGSSSAVVVSYEPPSRDVAEEPKKRSPHVDAEVLGSNYGDPKRSGMSFPS